MLSIYALCTGCVQIIINKVIAIWNWNFDEDENKNQMGKLNHFKLKACMCVCECLKDDARRPSMTVRDVVLRKVISKLQRSEKNNNTRKIKKL